MFVHFAAVVNGNIENYKKIINSISTSDHKLITNHYLNRTINEIKNESVKESIKFRKKFVTWMKKADVIIYEITESDINAGYELSFAMAMKKPVIILMEENKTSIPFVFRGIDDELIQIIEYNNDNLEYMVKEALAFSKEQLNMRFNFFITAKQNHFLEELSHQQKKPKSTLIRDLIDEAIQQKNTHLESRFKIE